MAADAYVGTFTKRTGTGTQDITGVGFQPTALVFWWTNQTANGAANASARISMGFSDGTNHRGVAHHSSDNVSTSECSRAWRNDACLLLYDADETADSIGVVSALGSDGFTVNWTTAAGSASVLIHFLALGGDIAAHVGDFLANTSTGNQSVTGVGFKPKGLFFLDAGWTASDTSAVDTFGPFGLGFVGSDGSQGTLSSDSEDNVNPANTTRYQRIDKCLARASSVGSIRHEAEFVSFDVDGFTVNWTSIDGVQSGIGGRIPYLAVSGCVVRVGVLTTPTSTGEVQTDTIANPQAVLLGSVGAAASASLQAQHRLTIGAFDGTNQAVSMTGDEDNVSATRAMGYHSDAAVMQMYDTVAADGATSSAVVTAAGVAFGVQSFTLDWTTVHATQRQVIYVAIGDAGIRGSAVFGETTTVTGSRSFAVGLNGEENLHDRPGWAIVFGNLQVTGDLEVDGGNVGGAAPNTPTYLTEDDETADLPNSRQLLAGANVSFDDTTPGERTINVSGSGVGDLLDMAFVRKPSDESVANSATLQDDDDLVFAVGASQIWTFRLVLVYTAAADAVNGKIKLAFTVPSGATVQWSTMGKDGTGTTNAGGFATNTGQTSGTNAGNHGGAGATLMHLLVDGIIVNSTNAGNVQLQWAQNATSGTATVVKANSFLIAQRFA